MTARLRRLVFAHDTWFLRGDDGRVWTDRGAIPWDRYLDIADEVVVAARQRALGPRASTDGLVRADRERVSFVAFPNLATATGRLVRRRAARHELRGLLGNADGLVARLPSEIGALACLAAEDVGRPWAVELVTCPWDALWNYGNWKGKVFAPLAWWETRRRLRRAPFALYVTESFLQRRYPSGGVAVGVSDVEIVPPGPEVLAARLRRVASSPAGARPLVFGTVGALLPFKGIDTAIEALAAVADRLPPFEFRVLGAGDPAPWQRLADERGVGDRVRFDGTRPAGEPVRAWLDEVDIYVQPSRQEGLPRALVEAMSRGCPAVGSTAGGIPELLDPDCLHRPGDVAALGRLLVRAATDAGWQEAQARRNTEVAGRYAPEVLDERRRAFWASFAGGARRRSGPRVLFVTPYSQLGGSERQLLHLLDGLGEEAVAGVVALQDGPLLARLRDPVLLPTGPGLLDAVRAARRLRPLLRERRPDVVHAACAKGALVGGLAALGLRTPVIFVKHDFYWDGPVAWVAAALCDQVVAGTEALNRTFPPLLRGRLHVVHPGVPPVAVDREAGRRRVAALTGGASRVVGMVARFHPDKGHLDAVAAVGHLPDAHLLLVGAVDTSTPEFRAEVERAASLGDGARVTFAGEQDDVVELLAGCDVAVVPSVVQEGFGLVVVEAFQAGTPVVAYGHGGLPEVVGEAGVLVPPRDTVALARAVASLLDDDEARAELVARGRERAGLFTTERLVAGMGERYRAATSRVSRAMASPHGPSA